MVFKQRLGGKEHTQTGSQSNAPTETHLGELYLMPNSKEGISDLEFTSAVALVSPHGAIKPNGL